MTARTASSARRRTALISAATAALVLGTATTAAADEHHDAILDAGVGCDFALGLDFVGGTRTSRTLTDEDGVVTGILVTGRAEAVVVTNLDTGASFTAPSRGAATRTTVTGPGASTVVHTGNLLLILFPTDDPAGPSTTLIQGRTVFTTAPDPFPNSDLITVRSTTGRTTDVCALLSS